MLVAPHPHLSYFPALSSVARIPGDQNGVSVPSGGSANTYGTWTQVHAGLTYPSELVLVIINAIETSGDVIAATTLNAYFDIGIGPDASNVTVIVEKLCGSNAQGIGHVYYFPLHIPPDIPIWVRHQNTADSAKGAINISFFGGNMNPGTLPRVERVVCLGATTASTTGTAITPGNTSAEGAWTQIVSSTAEDYAGIMIGGMFVVDTTMTTTVNTVLDAGLGSAGNEVSIGENLTLQFVYGANEQITSFSIPSLCGIPAGSRLCVRASTSVGTPDSNNSVVIYGLVH